MWFSKLAWWMLSIFTYQVVITIPPDTISSNNESVTDPLPGIVVNSEMNESNTQENVESQSIKNKPVIRSIQTRSIKNVNDDDDNELEPGIKIIGQVNRTIKTGEIYSTDPSPGVDATQKIGKVGNK